MARFEVRWSHLESRTPGARPFGVIFREPMGGSAAGLTVDGADLLFYEQFRSAVLALLGTVYTEPRVETADDVQRAWLDVLSEELPLASLRELRVTDAQDESRGIHHRFTAVVSGEPWAHAEGLEADQVLDYQMLQAAIAHQTGRLLRYSHIETIADPALRRRAWAQKVAPLLKR